MATPDEGQSLPEQEQELVQRAHAAASAEEAIEALSEALMLRIHAAFMAIDPDRAEDDLQALRRAGLDRLLTELVLAAPATAAASARALERMRAAYTSGEARANDLKRAILVFDRTAYRLALVADAQFPFSYPLAQNPVREALYAFARAIK